VEDFRSQSTYRFSATNAYYDVVLQRMDELKEEEIQGYMTMQEFLMRRITPAVKTCQTASHHLEDISRRVTRASDLLRTRVEMVLQEQNQKRIKISGGVYTVLAKCRCACGLLSILLLSDASIKNTACWYYLCDLVWNRGSFSRYNCYGAL
jgi:uncharacterized membrane-anchored protein